MDSPFFIFHIRKLTSRSATFHPEESPSSSYFLPLSKSTFEAREDCFPARSLAGCRLISISSFLLRIAIIIGVNTTKPGSCRTTIRQSTSQFPSCLFESYKQLNGRLSLLLNWLKSLFHFICWSNLQDFPCFRNLHSKQEIFEAHISLLRQQSTNEIFWWHSNFDFIPLVVPSGASDRRQRRRDRLSSLVDCFPTLFGWLFSNFDWSFYFDLDWT